VPSRSSPTPPPHPATSLPQIASLNQRVAQHRATLREQRSLILAGIEGGGCSREVDVAEVQPRCSRGAADV